ncbi:hypothetical protein PYH37_002787 [Sinorhizobium numidicum]|uniref:Uncharacterized protein n=1 Tax=Sinorhizobium numidicum TaxID=680248 RepID=A0ABY8D129_9HYPH|nr:hypothetical protein [Sinorhizobium numidicum]WEX77945.1 hypothetical protein PYH37_002787 [Sinorhizobium numidicum]WEX84604.1 hypothetical protein PYH38_003500 [Sinorhizobium numidicum]
MYAQRYGLKQESDGSWTVIDSETGQIAELSGELLTHLDIHLANEYLPLLKLRDTVAGLVRPRGDADPV